MGVFIFIRGAPEFHGELDAGIGLMNAQDMLGGLAGEFLGGAGIRGEGDVIGIEGGAGFAQRFERQAMAIADLGAEEIRQALAFMLLGQRIDARPALGAHRIPEHIVIHLGALIVPGQRVLDEFLQAGGQALQIPELAHAFQFVKRCQRRVVARHRFHRLVALLDPGEFLFGLGVFAALEQIDGLAELLRLHQIDGFRLGDSHVGRIGGDGRFHIADLGFGGGSDPDRQDVIGAHDEDGFGTEWFGRFLLSRGNQGEERQAGGENERSHDWGVGEGWRRVISCDWLPVPSSVWPGT